MKQHERVALISGAGRGIGAATAREFGRRGYHVVVNYRSNADAAASVVEAIEKQGGSARAVRADVCDADEVAALIEEVRGEHGHIDVLVCNANTVNPSFAPLTELSWEAFADKVNGELSGVFFLSQRALAVMREQRAGRIIFISSTAADYIGMAVAHSTAKAALNTFSRHVAGVGAQYGVTVNTIAFGAVRTESSGQGFSEGLQKYLTDRSVLTRLVEPEDAARTVALVADDDFGAVAGQLIRVEGGYDVLDQQLHPLTGHFN
ncbi:short-chain dehydrogenase [Streptomyces sp. WZ.A104]|uniref:SDR family oxidoreductase n=1 Tax=Streptomyces durocortorensis TaxID=2811104 RepID=A0ABY9W481_9ACTN|nr:MULTISPECIES: SDR family oxidoreductase [Streptomyces]PCG87295.1 short-chain dehydrogenase [Streptomyces sp. WZ.A104]WNF30956.1 SDR family oxidoreductase [Streptomyces durocortorensis]